MMMRRVFSISIFLQIFFANFCVGVCEERPGCACTPLCIMLPPEEIAFAAIRVAVEILEKDPPPALRSTSFDVNHDDVMLACRELFEHYKFPSAAQEQLGGVVQISRHIFVSRLHALLADDFHVREARVDFQVHVAHFRGAV